MHEMICIKTQIHNKFKEGFVGTHKFGGRFWFISWWRHQMETFSTLLALCAHFEEGFGSFHDDVIKWDYCPRHWPFVGGFHRSPVNSPHKGQWRGALMFSLICTWRNGWVNNRDAGDLRRHCAHYDVTVISMIHLSFLCVTWYKHRKLAYGSGSGLQGTPSPFRYFPRFSKLPKILVIYCLSRSCFTGVTIV